MESQSTRFDLPGFSLPLDYIPKDRLSERILFPNALEDTAVENAGYGQICMNEIWANIPPVDSPPTGKF